MENFTRSSSGRSTSNNFLLFMEMRKKIAIFRDIFDIPPLNGSVPTHELMISTAEDLHRMYPEFVSNVSTKKLKERNMYQGLICFYEALKCIGDSGWMEDTKVREKFIYDDVENVSMEELTKIVLSILDNINKAIKGRFDITEEDKPQKDYSSTSMPINMQPICCSPECKYPTFISPQTPTSILPEFPHDGDCESYSPPRVWGLRVQVAGRLTPMDLNRLSLHMILQNNIHNNQKIKDNEKCKDDVKGAFQVPTGDEMNQQDWKYEMKIKERTPLGQTPMTIKTEYEDGTLVPPLTLEFESEGAKAEDLSLSTPNHAQLQSQDLTAAPLQAPPLSPPPPPPLPPPPPPPLPMDLKGGVVGPSSPAPLWKAQAPPVSFSNRSLRVKTTSKLKRSSHMGNMYRLLKGKVEGSSSKGKSAHGKKDVGSSNAGGGQCMDDALAEMTKRSVYFQRIEQDVEKHGNVIKEMEVVLNSFQTKDMDELLKFHKQVESKLEVLTDESLTLSRFEGFPVKKLEALRMAAALYTKLSGIASKLQNWQVECPLGQLLDRVEKYFNKIKGEVEALERIKDEEAKKFKNHNIHFDFDILIKIKEAIVDVSSSCMELALKERREAKANDQNWSKPGGQKKVCAKMLWRAFQFAFKVYSFAGGQDEHADTLTRELAKEIETDPMQD